MPIDIYFQIVAYPIYQDGPFLQTVNNPLCILAFLGTFLAKFGQPNLSNQRGPCLQTVNNPLLCIVAVSAPKALASLTLDREAPLPCSCCLC